jgi:hypothetical protein
LAPILSENNIREQEALQGYYQLLLTIDGEIAYYKEQPQLKNVVIKYLQPLREAVEEFISDELNHAGELHKFQITFGMIKEAID